MAGLALVVPVLTAVAGVGVGGFLVHRWTLRREMLGARRAQRVDYLVEAYRRLVDGANRENTTDVQRQNIEAALSDIMLLGESKEVEAARRFMVLMADDQGADLNPVIKALRSSLRQELGLPELPLPAPYNLRFRPR